MNSVNNVLNRIDDWSQPLNPYTGVAQGFFSNQVKTRAATIAVVIPSEIVAITQNIIKAPVQAVGCVLNIAVKGLTCISGSETLKKFEQKLPGLSDFFKTIARIVAYTVGTIFSATLGVIISPYANFKLHCVMGLAVNRREAAIKLANLDEQLIKNDEIKTTDAEVIVNIERETQNAEQKAFDEAYNNFALAYSTNNDLEKFEEENKAREVNPLNDENIDVSAFIDEDLNSDEYGEYSEEDEDVELGSDYINESEQSTTRWAFDTAWNAPKNVMNAAYNTTFKLANFMTGGIFST